MTSSRLPGKVLMELEGAPMLAQQLRRLRRCRLVDDITVATTVNSTDDPLVSLADAEGVRWFRGSEDDVLSRFVGAAREAGAEAILRVTSDCPLLDPVETDRVVAELTDHAAECDYAANLLHRTYPRGLDVEALFSDTLARIDRLARTPLEREHVTVVPRERPELFLVRSVEDAVDNSDLRWTVDTPRDLELVRRLYGELQLARRDVSYPEVVAYVRSTPELATWNAGIETWTPRPRASSR